MQNVWNLIQIKTLHLFLLLGLSLASCTTVYFEKPVPQHGAQLTSIPADWVGTYLSEDIVDENATLVEQIIRPCFRLEIIGTNQLLVSSEYRIQASDMPQLREVLENQKRDGTLTSYQLSETMLLRTVRGEDREEQQYTALIKQGSWYILTQTISPFRLFDLEAGTQTEFDLEKGASLFATGLPEADSIASKTSKLIARKDRNAWYFNTQEAGAAKWTLLCVEQPTKGRLVVKTSQLEQPDDFKNRQEYFNAITPFREMESDQFVIDPDDAALARLLAESGLFQTSRLRKIKD